MDAVLLRREFSMETLPALPFCVVLVAVMAAAATDLSPFRIRNVLTLPLFLSGICYHVWEAGARGFIESLLGVLAATLLLGIVYELGGIGAGDMKLMSGVGAWLGPWAALHVVVVSGLATGIYSAVLYVWQRERREPAHIAPALAARVGPTHFGSTDASRETDLTISSILVRPDVRLRVVPFGAMVALAIVVTAIWMGVAS
jgi:prepilin peptidase CpaA